MGGGGGRTTFGFYFDGFPLDILCHIASALEAMAFLSVDFYYLRLFEISAMFLMAIYNIVVLTNHPTGFILHSFTKFPSVLLIISGTQKRSTLENFPKSSFHNFKILDCIPF